MLVILAAAGIADSAVGEPPPLCEPPPLHYGWEGWFGVEVRAEAHKSGEVTYHYRIVNRLSSPIAEITIGLVPSLDEPELRVTPIDWALGTNDCPSSMTAPQGWTACVRLQEESDHHFVTFTAKGDSAFLKPDAALKFSVNLARPDSTYLTARYWAHSTGLSEQGQVIEVNDDE